MTAISLTTSHWRCEISLVSLFVKIRASWSLQERGHMVLHLGHMVIRQLKTGKAVIGFVDTYTLVYFEIEAV